MSHGRAMDSSPGDASTCPGPLAPSRARRVLVYWLPLALYLGLIFALSAFSRLPFTLPPVRHLDKLLHLGEYAGLAFLLSRALRAERPRAAALRLWLGAVLLVTILGGLDEMLQGTVPNRDSDVLDLGADVLGGMIGAALYLAGRRTLNRRGLRSSRPDG